MLSVIVCTYNRSGYIFNVLESVARNLLPVSEYEVVVVDNNSTDNTRGEVERFARTWGDVCVSYVFEERQGLSFARNRGVEVAKGDVIVYVDDDALVNREFLASYKEFFDRHVELCAAGGPIVPRYETAEPEWMSCFTRQLLTAYLYKGNKERKFKRGEFPGGGNAAYRKGVFERVGLFNTELGRRGDGLFGAEEKDIFDKMRDRGMEVYYVPGAVLYHLIPARKLERDYFDRLTLSIGRSERKRTLAVSQRKFYGRLVQECVKWCATLLLFVGYTFAMTPQKGCKLVAFRWNVTKGLLKD